MSILEEPTPESIAAAQAFMDVTGILAVTPTGNHLVIELALPIAGRVAELISDDDVIHRLPIS